MTRAFVAVGSNIRPAANVRAAIRALAQRVKLVAVSTVYRTEPIGPRPQPRFYNCVVEIRTDMPPQTLKLRVLRHIEKELGRLRTSDKYAPRTVDLDLILYGNLLMKSRALTLPDPEIAVRPFLAIPLAELAPRLKLPGASAAISTLASRLPSSSLRSLRAYTNRLRKELLASRCPRSA